MLSGRQSFAIPPFRDTCTQNHQFVSGHTTSQKTPALARNRTFLDCMSAFASRSGLQPEMKSDFLMMSDVDGLFSDSDAAKDLDTSHV